MKTVLVVLIVAALFCAIYFVLTCISNLSRSSCRKKNGELTKEQEPVKDVSKGKEKVLKEGKEEIHEPIHPYDS